jgi:hypothetical protein
MQMLKKQHFGAGEIIAHQGDAVKFSLVPLSGELSLRERTDIVMDPEGIPA